MYCNQCGKQIPDDSRFCSFCGANLTAGQSTLRQATVQTDPNFDIRNGVLVSYKGHDRNVVVPSGVVEIAKEAFTEKYLESITIPEGCKNVYIHSFAETIRLPKSVENFVIDAVWTNSVCRVPASRLVFEHGTKKVHGRIWGQSVYGDDSGYCVDRARILASMHRKISVFIPDTVEEIWINHILPIEACLELEAAGNINEYPPNAKGAIWRYQKKCQYCGGDLVKGWLSNSLKCRICGKEKGYKDLAIYIK